MAIIIRQGDIILVQIEDPQKYLHSKNSYHQNALFNCNNQLEDELEEAGYQRLKGNVIRWGERRNSAHRLVGQASIFKKRNEKDDNPSLVIIESPSLLAHPEHVTLRLKPGIYDVRFERSYNPFDDRYIIVRD